MISSFQTLFEAQLCGLPDRGLMRPPFSLWRMVEDAAIRTPAARWAQGDYGALTYAEGWVAIRRLATHLKTLGVGHGDHVAVCMPNHPAFALVAHATWLLGAAVAALHPAYAETAQAAQLNLVQPRLLVTTDIGDLAERCARLGVAARCTVLTLPSTASWADWNSHLDAYEGPFSTATGDLALLQFTGGTTGKPKAAMLTHETLSLNLAQMALVIDTMEPEHQRSLAIAPFAHITGFSAVLNLTTYMRSVVSYLVLGTATKIEQACVGEGVTYLVGPPTLLVALSEHATSMLGATLRHVISGGAPLPAAVKDRFEALTGAMVMNGYGLSETSPAVTLSHGLGPGDIVSVGRAMPGTIITIVGADGVGLPPGQVGEICVSGPQVGLGYLDDPEASALAFRHDGFHTGDLGYLDVEGRLFIVDRLKDIIIASGYNIYPANVEDAIYHHPAVAEVAVIGVPHPYRGETVRAVVALRAGETLTLESLRAFLTQKLSPMEMPAELEVRASLPKSPAGKILRREVRLAS